MPATNIPPPRMQICDPNTGMVTRDWFRWFYDMFVLNGSGGNVITLEDLQLGPADTQVFAETVLALEQYAQTLPVPLDPVLPVEWYQPSFIQLPPPDDLSPVDPPPSGATGTFTTADAKTVTVRNGIIVSIV